MSRIKKIILPVFLLALFTFYQVSVTMFTHVHYVNGVMIVHSHPSTHKNHTHTNGQLIVINRLNVFHALEIHFAEAVTVIRPVLWLLKENLQVADFFSENKLAISLRAPPSFTFS